MKKLKQTFRQFGDDFEKATAKELLHYAKLINRLQIKRYFSAIAHVSLPKYSVDKN
jgi:hypothetical protein